MTCTGGCRQTRWTVRHQALISCYVVEARGRGTWAPIPLLSSGESADGISHPPVRRGWRSRLMRLSGKKESSGKGKRNFEYADLPHLLSKHPDRLEFLTDLLPAKKPKWQHLNLPQPVAEKKKPSKPRHAPHLEPDPAQNLNPLLNARAFG
jgi:hypothetical protein